MPELPEVETVVRKLRPRLLGARLDSLAHLSPLLKLPRRFKSDVVGRTLVAIERHGKWMFHRLDDGGTLVLHLGMSGRLGVYPADSPPLPHSHLRLAVRLADGSAAEFRFSDPRRFGFVGSFAPVAFAAEFGPEKLGPDALDVSRQGLAEALAGSKRSIKSALMDQRTIAGIGNIYADEILFTAGIKPGARAGGLSPGRLDRLHPAVGDVLGRAIEANGTSVHTFVDVDGERGEYQEKLFVYGREGKPCRICGAVVKGSRTLLAGRMTCWCPKCQR
ncbi:MAG TPA: bifunctional DNA-formamidopyrimidine glycosylase/DNA-(apurinic or apyrimidinic site) lyase [Planctomycetia bacterium]|nr:bifunctional DNA-formamidopyrimidine glycosylase/DNA-(apurinic or apyrimidinic site) lyase [Planctomycetia bacterium]